MFATKPLYEAAVVGLLLSGMVANASAADKQSAADVSARSSTTFYQFPGSPRVAISSHGNLTKFEGPVGYDHIGVGAFSEGYILCYGPTRAFDTGAAEFRVCCGDGHRRTSTWILAAVWVPPIFKIGSAAANATQCSPGMPCHIGNGSGARRRSLFCHSEFSVCESDGADTEYVLQPQ